MLFVVPIRQKIITCTYSESESPKNSIFQVIGISIPGRYTY